MKSLTRWMVAVSVVALAVFAFAPVVLADGVDDVASFNVSDRLKVGSVTLEPGVYIVRALHAGSGRNVLVVSNAVGTETLAALLTTPHQLAPQEIQGESRLLYEAGDDGRPGSLRSFLVANTAFGYDILPSAQQPARAASARVKELVAIASAR